MVQYELCEQNGCTVLRVFAYVVIVEPVIIAHAYTVLHIIVEQNAQVTIIDAHYQSEQEIIITASCNALVYYYMHGVIEQEKKCARTICSIIERNAQVAIVSSLHCFGTFLLHCNALLCDTKAQFFSGTLVLVAAEGLYVQHIEQKHIEQHTASCSLLHGMVGKGGKLENNGLIIIEDKAKHASAEHRTKCLITGMGGKAHAKPMLEIAPKEVFAKHGAAIGPLDQQLIRFLQYRGLAIEKAEMLLKRAFFEQMRVYWPFWVSQQEVKANIAPLEGLLEDLLHKNID